MFTIWHSTKEQKTLSQHLCEKLLVSIVDSVKEEFPELDLQKEKLINDASNEITNLLHAGIDKIDTKELFKMGMANLKQNLVEYSLEEDKIDILNSKIEDAQNFISASEKIFSDVKSERQKNFKSKIELIKQYQTIITKQEKPEINILALGPSQVGKTALVKRIFNLNNKTVKLNGGTASDTSFVSTYKYVINEIVLNYTDTPGFFDSRGTEEENMERIVDFIKKTPIDIIIWVSKMGTLIDINQINLLKSLTGTFGKNIWRKTIVVLSHANSNPPQEYYNGPDDEIDPSITKLQAWKKYTEEFKKAWKNAFAMFSDVENIPIVLTENNIMDAKKIADVYTLYDGTPIIETLMIEFFNVIQMDKAPIMFLSLAGDLENFMKKKEKEKKKEEKKKEEKNIEVECAKEKENENSIPLKKLPKLHKKKRDTLTEQQIALDAATTFSLLKSEKKPGFCILF